MSLGSAFHNFHTLVFWLVLSSSSMHASLYCLVLFICSVLFTISRSVDCRRGTDTRERRREGVRGEGRKDRGRKYARHMNFQKFLTTKALTKKHPFVAPKCS